MSTYRQMYYRTHKEQVLMANRKYRIANAEEVSKRKKAARAANWDKIRAQERRSCAVNREKILERKRKCYLANKETICGEKKAKYAIDGESVRRYMKQYRTRDQYREQRNQYIANNAEKIKQRERKYRMTHRGLHAEQARRAYHERPEIYHAIKARRRAMERVASGANYTTATHIQHRKEIWGNLCWICGAVATATDHVKPLAAGGSHFPANLRPICKSCNSKKGSTWKGVNHVNMFAKAKGCHL